MDKNIIKSALTFFSSSVVVQFINFMSQVLLMKYLSVKDFGLYSLSFEGLAMCNMVISSAFRNFYMREINKGINADDLLSYQLIYGSLWCIISTVIVGLVFSLSPIIITAMSISMVISSVILPVWVELLVSGRKKKIIIRDVTYAICTIVSIAFACLLDKIKVQGLIIVILTINAVIAIVFFMDKKKVKKLFEFDNIKNIEASITPFFLVFIVNTVYNKIGVTFINQFAGVVFVAKYLATFKFITPLFFIQTALISSVLPKFKSDNNFKFDMRYFSFFAMPGLVISILLPFILPIVIDMLGLHNYDQIPHFLTFGSSIIFIAFIYGSLANYISIKGGQKLIIKTNVVGVLVYVALLSLVYLFCDKSHYIELCLSLFVITESFICMRYYSEVKKTNKINIVFLIAPLLTICLELFFILHFLYIGGGK